MCFALGKLRRWCVPRAMRACSGHCVDALLLGAICSAVIVMLDMNVQRQLIAETDKDTQMLQRNSDGSSCYTLK